MVVEGCIAHVSFLIDMRQRTTQAVTSEFRYQCKVALHGSAVTGRAASSCVSAADSTHPGLCSMYVQQSMTNEGDTAPATWYE